MATVERINEALTRLDLVVGQTRVSGVRTRIGQDPSGDPAVIVKLALADPPRGLDTWPVDDLWEIRRLVNDTVRQVDPELEIPWLISFEAEDLDELDPDDLADEIQLSED